jgi:ketosteroid isomerase-like protein
MSSEENKAAVLAWLDAVNKGDEQGIMDLVTEDFIFKTMARRPEWLQYRWDRHEFAAAPKAQSSLMVSPIQMQMVRIIAEGDIVVLEGESDGWLKNGKHYDNAYSLIFSFVDGKIQEVREYSCSHLVVETFGEFNPNNPGASGLDQAAEAS